MPEVSALSSESSLVSPSMVDALVEYLKYTILAERPLIPWNFEVRTEELSYRQPIGS
jgi:hypothetical protein